MMQRSPLILVLLACVFAVSARAVETGANPWLVAMYSDGKHRVVTLAPTPNFVLKDSESIHPQIAPQFTAQWTGLLKIVKRAKYTITPDGSPDAKVSIDGNDIAGKSVELDPGDHPITIELTRRPGKARLQLLWASDFLVLEPVPSSVLVHRDAPQEVVLDQNAQAGAYLVEELNCVACHHTASRSISGRPAPDLTFAGTRLRPAWIAKWLQHPRSWPLPHPQAALTDEQRRNISAFLATLKDPNNKVKEQPQPSRIEAGKQLFEGVGCTACHGKEANALQGVGSKWLTGQLAEYLLNPLAVDHSGRMPSMLLQKEEALAIAEYLAQFKDPALEGDFPGGDAKRGQQIVQAQGCINCHVIEVPKGKLLASNVPPAAPLERLGGHEAGCLSENPSGKAINYGFDKQKRGLISAFLATIRDRSASPAPVYEFYHKLTTLGCMNCHETEGNKPSDAAERIPPLTNIGGRLRKEWINDVLTQKRRIHPWLHTRMPDFGPAVRDLAELAVAASGAVDAEPLPVPSRDEILEGQKLLGTGAGGLACITCHGFAGVKPSVGDDTRGPDINTAAARLRPDHFRRWVLDPKRVDPATPMPTFFDAIAPAEAHAKIETIFRYVAMGPDMPPPAGWIDTNNYIVAVRDEPVVIRAVMPNPAAMGQNLPRGIAVGLPQLISYCFDAQTCTLRYAWTGGFLDMQPSWSGRGGNVVKVLGKRFYMTNIYPLRIGETESEPAREFVGYVLVDKVPQFIYRIGGVEVHETITALPKDLGLVRTFELDSGGKPVTFLAIDEKGITYTSSAGEWQTTKIADADGRILRLPGGKVKFSVTITAKETK